MAKHRYSPRKYGLAIFLLVVTSVAFSFHVRGAVDQTIHTIDVSVSLAEDGSAHIQERWEMTVEEGTEIYKTLQLPDGERMTEYSVKMDGRPLTLVSNWNVDGNFEEKAGTYGQNEDELNWGITSYGHHVYEISYSLTPFVMETTTGEQMIFWQFINEELAVPPAHFSIHLAAENQAMGPEAGYRVWGFGFEGKTDFSDGAITAETTESMRSDGKGVLLVKIPAGTFTQPLAMDRSFDEYVSGAFEGSTYSREDYEEGKTVSDGGAMRPSKQKERTDKIMRGIFIGIGGIAGISMILWLFARYKRRRAVAKYYPNLKKASKNMQGEYYRELPVPDIYSGYAFLNDLAVENLEENYFSVGLLVLARANYLTVAKDHKNRPVLWLSHEKSAPAVPVNELWQFLTSAVRTYRVKNDGNYITQKQLKRYASEHWGPLKSYLEEVKRESNTYVRENHLRATRQTVASTNDSTLALANTEIATPLNEEGLVVRDHWVQFYNYLKDFSLLSEREINEVKLWDQLLIYAAALGIAEEVQREFARVHPQNLEDSVFIGSTGTFNFVDYYIWSSIIHNTYVAKARGSLPASSSAGFGGGTSFGGGGGSFGGGAGGGAR